jgi:hypothetical protein
MIQMHQYPESRQFHGALCCVLNFELVISPLLVVRSSLLSEDTG